ncbi:MAG: GTPase ObgE [Bellilinea sp.]
MFIDEAAIFVRSGKGGDGFVHFHREKYVNRGGPDGGDGGRGGDVILKVVPTLNTLVKFRYQRKFIADDGKKGGVNNMTGRSAEDLVIPVPPGTVVYDDTTGELLGDLTDPDQQLVVCKGGRGGRGNPHFASSRNQAPTTGEKGVPAEERNLRLELKLIADVGLVGVPNAGKSSFLAAVTNARPKIADYPFTTVEPNLGVAELDMDTTLVLADIPGLIEGAHQGIGLGDAFLRHIQRTRVLIHLLDGMSEDPLADFSQINSELALFDPELSRKPVIVALNKIDLPEVQERWPEIKKQLVAKGVSEPVAISALAHTSLEPILWKCVELLQTAPEPVVVKAVPIYRPADDPQAFTITRTDDGGYKVRGAAIERAAKMTYWEFEGSVRRFQKLIETLGVESRLREMGIENGDTVYIGDEHELEWQD